MSKQDPYVTYICEDVLADISGITSKRMFGGYGIYKDGIFFAIIADGQTYFKVDKTNQEQYELHGSKPFTYQNKNKTVALSYWLVPENVLEDRELIAEWVDQSVEINLKK